MFEKEAEKYAERHAFRVPYDGSNKFYDDNDYECSKEGFQKGAEFGYNKTNEWHYCKDELPPIGETVLLFYGNDVMGKVVMSTGSIDSKGNWYKNVDDTPIMWQLINLPPNKNITKDYLYCDNQLLPDDYIFRFI